MRRKEAGEAVLSATRRNSIFSVGNLSHSSFFSRDDFQMLFPSLFFAPLPEAEEKEASQQPHLFPPPPSQLISWPVSTYVRRFQLRRRWRLSSGPPYKTHTQGKKRRRRRLSQAAESVCISRRRRLPSSHIPDKSVLGTIITSRFEEKILRNLFSLRNFRSKASETE